MGAVAVLAGSHAESANLRRRRKTIVSNRRNRLYQNRKTVPT